MRTESRTPKKLRKPRKLRHGAPATSLAVPARFGFWAVLESFGTGARNAIPRKKRAPYSQVDPAMLESLKVFI